MDRMLSGIKPTGKLTLGNYIGAIRQFVKYQDEYEMFIFIANMHAITVPIDADELKKNTRDLAALYLACGIDPKKTTMFVQTDILEHANLGFVLTCNAYMGELSRMTQYKDKAAKEKNIGVGIYTYPTLMAADILLYNPSFVPVGDDQKQHVELTRDLAIRFNNKYGEIFKVPTPLTLKNGSRIMSLSHPDKKMSKSEVDGDKGCIYLLDDVNVARKKIMSAVTDSDMLIKFDPVNKPGVSNLLTILSSLSNISIEELEKKYEGCNYGTLKKDVADTVCDFLTSLQAKYNEIINSNIIDDILDEGAKKAKTIASDTLKKVYKVVGLER